MAGNVIEAQSHCEVRDGRSVTGLHGIVTGKKNKSVTGGMEKQQVYMYG